MRSSMIVASVIAVAAASCCDPAATCDDSITSSCVCNFDPYCCETEWDAQCVHEAKDACAMACAVPCAGPEKPLCVDAEVQAPRDLLPGAAGERPAKAAVLNDEQAHKLPQTNIHFHFGAEHRSEAYKNGTDSEKYDAANGRRLAEGVRPGWMCENDHLTTEQLEPYDWQHCTGDMYVGKSYEVHYVHSSAGTYDEDLSDGLGSAAGGRGQLNPMVAVEAMVFLIVNDEEESHLDDDLVHGWDHTVHNDAVMYAGSTTGPSHNNEICSPYTVTWHVDRQCHEISAKSFDRMCKDMADLYGMEGDLYPHGSRILLDPAWVVPDEEVVPLS